eukprot:2117464-Alexandrium_andersonii.AAC.1
MVLAARQQRRAKAPLPALANRIARQSAASAIADQSERFSRSAPCRQRGGGPIVKQALGFFVDSTLPVPAQ